MHAGSERDLLVLSLAQESFVEGPYRWVESHVLEHRQVDRGGSEAGYDDQTLEQLLPRRLNLNGFVEMVVDLFDLALKLIDQRMDVVSEVRRHDPQPALFHRRHLQQLPSADQQATDKARVFIDRPARWWLDGGSELGDQRRIGHHPDRAQRMVFRHP